MYRQRGIWPGRGPFSYLPPWQRPGWLYGGGFGRGFGWWTGNPYVCARFPWLPRWWWANPQGIAPTPQIPSAQIPSVQVPSAQTPAEELSMLENEKANLEQALREINKRLDELRQRK